MSTGTLDVEGQTYKFVKQRLYDPVRIYSGEGTFLRIGPAEAIGTNLGLHKKLLSYGFPVPQIIKEGMLGGEAFYIEESVGNEVLADRLHADWKESGSVSEETFSKLLKIVDVFAKAQLATAKEGVVGEAFYNGIHMNHIVEERPDFEGEVSAAYEKIKKNVSAFPIVMTHGDFNPFNLLENGVIDFEGTFDGPAGYDLITGIYHGYLFPKGDGYEMQRMFELTTSR